MWIIERTTAELIGDPWLCARGGRSAARLGAQRLGASPVLHPQVRAGLHRRGGAGDLLRVHAARDGGHPGGARPRRCLHARAGAEGVSAGAEGAEIQNRAGHFRAVREGVPGDRRGVPGDGAGRSRHVLRCDHHRRVPGGQGAPGTLGELSPKPHPWLYAEAACIGLGIPFEERATSSASRIAARGSARCGWRALRPSAWPAATSRPAARAPSATRIAMTCIVC